MASRGRVQKVRTRGNWHRGLAFTGGAAALCAEQMGCLGCPARCVALLRLFTHRLRFGRKPRPITLDTVSHVLFNTIVTRISGSTNREEHAQLSQRLCIFVPTWNATLSTLACDNNASKKSFPSTSLHSFSCRLSLAGQTSLVTQKWDSGSVRAKIVPPRGLALNFRPQRACNAALAAHWIRMLPGTPASYRLCDNTNRNRRRTIDPVVLLAASSLHLAFFFFLFLFTSWLSPLPSNLSRLPPCPLNRVARTRGAALRLRQTARAL